MCNIADDVDKAKLKLLTLSNTPPNLKYIVLYGRASFERNLEGYQKVGTGIIFFVLHFINYFNTTIFYSHFYHPSVLYHYPDVNF